jgi:phosphohistidine phosphatase
MKLYLVRHGESSTGVSDNERPLSEKGKTEIQGLANVLSPLRIQVSQIFHSEKRRAEQTALILASAIKSYHPPELRLDLDPLASVAPIVNESYSWHDDIMLVGHMPFMGILAAKLVCGNENENVVNFTTGCIVCLEQIEQRRWVINWVINPKLLDSENNFPSFP